MGASVGVGLGLFITLSKKLPAVAGIEAPEATIIYSSDGVVLGRVYHEDRTNVPLKDIPKSLRDATIAIEDSRFYEHSGVDLRGIARSVWVDVKTGHPRSGGSTITQQLARNVYLTQQKTMQRKVQEAVLAILIERRYTKDKILELYLNQVYYGSGAFGVEAASKVYFGKDVDKLDLSQSALLAGLPQKPSGYSPHDDLTAALERRDVVLNRMAELGKITPEERDAAKAETPRIIPRRNVRNTYRAPHFVDYVTRQLKERYGDDVVSAGGLRVYTTLDSRMQEIAENALRAGVKKHEKGHRVTEGCMIVIEPQNGYVRAMVGSVNPRSEFNRCTQGQGRQPGSSFKAFVYTAAFMAGMKPDDRISEAPVSYPNGTGGTWSPRNYDGKYSHTGSGWLTVKQAVAWSVNTAAIRVAEKVGIKNVIKYAQLMGVHSKLDPYLSTAIGGIGGVHPIEMASAYGTFANGGVHVDPCSIIRVTTSHGDIIEDYKPVGERVMPEKINAEMDELFRGVVTMGYGTGGKVRDVPEARGKTGTTNDDRDAWWLGYVPNKLVAAVWVGNDNYAPMQGAYGGVVCAPIWREFMLKAVPIFDRMRRDSTVKVKQAASEGDKQANASKPDKAPDRSKPDAVDVNENPDPEVVTVTICDDSQLLATRNCPSTHTEKLLRGTEPKTYCTMHAEQKPSQPPSETSNPAVPAEVTLSTVKLCAETGMLASKFCPKTITKRIPVDEIPGQVCTKHRGAGM